MNLRRPRRGLDLPVGTADTQPESEALNDVPYDRRRLSYANTFPNPIQANFIRVMEWLTAKLRLLRLIRRFEAMSVPHGQGFWAQALGVMGIELTTPQAQIDNIPETGPLVIVANHPHGLVDGMVLAELIGRRRTDYKILTRSLLTGVAEIDDFMIPVPFPHEPDALERNLEMRKKANDHLKAGGCVVVFPAGEVASSKSWFGPAIEKEWHTFTSKMILRSEARVVPIYFQGQNSRYYQIANKISAVLRQSLLLYEVRYALNKPQAPIVGEPIERGEIDDWSSNQRGFISWLREKTLALKPGS
ncbi:MAG: lysophospholipid acyltransferase family protein [Vannielia sp.]|nr:acyltransferase [Oceanicola sp. 502str15]